MQRRPVPDQRQRTRRVASIVVGSRRKYPTPVHDITHARSISQGGMLLTPARVFAPGARLAIRTRLPFRGSLRLVTGTVEVVESREIEQRLLYEIRVRFVDLDRRSFQIIGDLCAVEADVLVTKCRSRE